MSDEELFAQTRAHMEKYSGAASLDRRLWDATVRLATRSAGGLSVTDAMVDRFLSWRLPEDFHPDAGISFKREYNEGTPYPGKHQPIGTNLLTATQAKAMLEHVVGTPRSARTSTGDTERLDFLAEITNLSALEEAGAMLSGDQKKLVRRVGEALSAKYELHRRINDTPEAFRLALDEAMKNAPDRSTTHP